MEVKIDDILHTLTLEEKVSLLSGKDFWQTVPIKEKGVPAIKVSFSTPFRNRSILTSSGF